MLVSYVVFASAAVPGASASIASIVQHALSTLAALVLQLYPAAVDSELRQQPTLLLDATAGAAALLSPLLAIRSVL